MQWPYNNMPSFGGLPPICGSDIWGPLPPEPLPTQFQRYSPPISSTRSSPPMSPPFSRNVFANAQPPGLQVYTAPLSIPQAYTPNLSAPSANAPIVPTQKLVMHPPMDMDPIAKEEFYIKQLDAKDADTTRFLNSLNTGVPSPDRLSAAWQALAQAEAYYNEFTRPASQLAALGLPRVEQRLTALVIDAREAKRIYGEMVNSANGHAVKRQQIWQDAQHYTQKVMQDVGERQKRQFEDSNRAWSAAFRGEAAFAGRVRFCSHCGHNMGEFVRAGSYCGSCGFQLPLV